VINPETDAVLYEGTGDYSSAEFRRWMGEACRRASEQGYRVTACPVAE